MWNSEKEILNIIVEDSGLEREEEVSDEEHNEDKDAQSTSYESAAEDPGTSGGLAIWRKS